MIQANAIEFNVPTMIVHGPDVINRIAEQAAEYGDKVMIVTQGKFTRKLGLVNKVETLLERKKVKYITFDSIRTNPDNEIIDEGAALAHQSRCNLIIALGSSSSINAAKAISLMAMNEGPTVEYLNGRYHEKLPLPVIAIPTVPGSFVDINDSFSIVDQNDSDKKVYRHRDLFPIATLVDPKIMITLPPNYTAGTGISITGAAIECYISSSSNAISDALSIQAMDFVTSNIKHIMGDRDNVEARGHIAMAGILASIALLIGHRGACHALAMTLAAHAGIYERIANVIILPHVMEFNLTATPGKYVQIARSLGEEVSQITVVEAAIKAVEGVRKLLFDLKIPQRLSEYKIKKDHLPMIASHARRYQFLNYVPRPLSKEDLLNVLISAY